MRSCAGPLLCAIGLLAAPACGDDLATNDGACEPLSFAIDALTLKWQWTTDNVTGIRSSPMSTTMASRHRPQHRPRRQQRQRIRRARPPRQRHRQGEVAHPPQPGGTSACGSHGRATVVVSNVDGDRVPDIVYAGRPDLQTSTSPIHAVNGAGELLWTSHHPSGQTARITVQYGAPAVANLDTNPAAEIAFGAAILDNDGLLVSGTRTTTAASSAPRPTTRSRPR